MTSFQGVAIAAPSASSDPAKLFEELGTKFGIDKKITDTLVNAAPTGFGCTNLEDFIHLVVGDNDWSAVVDKSGVANKHLEASRLRQAHLNVKDAVTKAKRSASAASADDDLDVLLPSDDLLALFNNFWKRYKVTFPPDRSPADSVVSRARKEILRRLLCVADVMKTKTQTHSSQPHSKKKESIGIVTITTELEDDPTRH